MSGRLVRLNGVSNDMDVILKRSMDGLERPQSDAPVYPAVGLRSTYPNGSNGSKPTKVCKNVKAQKLLSKTIIFKNQIVTVFIQTTPIKTPTNHMVTINFRNFSITKGKKTRHCF